LSQIKKTGRDQKRPVFALKPGFAGLDGSYRTSGGKEIKND
jgi:hypothetical protein